MYLELTGCKLQSAHLPSWWLVLQELMHIRLLAIENVYPAFALKTGPARPPPGQSLTFSASIGQEQGKRKREQPFAVPQVLQCLIPKSKLPRMLSGKGRFFCFSMLPWRPFTSTDAARIPSQRTFPPCPLVATLTEVQGPLIRQLSD